MAHEQFYALGVNVFGTVNVVGLGDVGELVSKALSVEVFLSVGSLVLYNLVGYDYIFVAGLLA